METTQKLLRFLDESPTCYHAAANVCAALKAAGAVELRESEPWRLERGTLYVVVRGDSALMAFRLPEGKPRGFLLAAAHDDSPTFKLRENAEVRAPGDTLRLSVEPYGGGIWRGWLDRPLSVAGRVMVRQGERLVTRLVNIDRDLLVIPSVAIHMDRTVNKGFGPRGPVAGGRGGYVVQAPETRGDSAPHGWLDRPLWRAGCRRGSPREHRPGPAGDPSVGGKAHDDSPTFKPGKTRRCALPAETGAYRCASAWSRRQRRGGVPVLTVAAVSGGSALPLA